MEDKSLELLTEEEQMFFEEYHNCKNEEEVQALMERTNKLHESRENNEIPHLDMTLEEFRAKYHTISHEELMKKYGF